MRGNFDHVIGVDEAGRGPLAGPVVAAACFIPKGTELEGIVDSKLVTKEETRERLYEQLISHPNVRWGVCIVDHATIDRINILQATMQAMRNATIDLLSKEHPDLEKTCLALIDGNRVPENMPVEATSVIKGDGCIFSIAAASLIAKVTRDRIMLDADKKYPEYNFAKHKGYGTKEHMAAITTHGPCPIHRLTFRPIRKD